MQYFNSMRPAVGIWSSPGPKGPGLRYSSAAESSPVTANGAVEIIAIALPCC
jgi:hypothetical protein